MKPELICLDFSGRHNDHLAESTRRMADSALWKQQRIVVIVPAGEKIPTKVYLTHWNLGFPPNNAVAKIIAIGQEVGEAYNNAIESILQHPELSKWEYILTLEHDNMPPQDGVASLIESMDKHPEFDCIGGLYWTKGEGGVPQIWGDPKDPVLNFRPQVPLQDQVQECCGTGMGFNLWRMSFFKDPKLRKPWFKTVFGSEGIGTQDLYFWGDARKHGHRCAVDTRVRVGHYDSENDMVW